MHADFSGSAVAKIATTVSQHLVAGGDWLNTHLPLLRTGPGSTVLIAAFLGALGGALAGSGHPLRSSVHGLVQSGAAQWVSERSAAHFDLDRSQSQERSHLMLTVTGAAPEPAVIEAGGVISAGATGALGGLIAATLFRNQASLPRFAWSALRSAFFGLIGSVTTTVLSQGIAAWGSAPKKGRRGVCREWVPNGTGWTITVKGSRVPPDARAHHERYLASLGYAGADGQIVADKFRARVREANDAMYKFFAAHGHNELNAPDRSLPVLLSRGKCRAGPINDLAASDHRTQLAYTGEQEPIDPKNPEHRPWNYCRIRFEWGTAATPEQARWAILAALIPAIAGKEEIEWTGDKDVKFRKGIAEYEVGRKPTTEEDKLETKMRDFNLGTFQYLAWVADQQQMPVDKPNKMFHPTFAVTRELASHIEQAEGSSQGVFDFQTALLDAAGLGKMDPLIDFLCRGAGEVSEHKREQVKARMLDSKFIEAYELGRTAEE